MALIAIRLQSMSHLNAPNRYLSIFKGVTSLLFRRSRWRVAWHVQCISSHTSTSPAEALNGSLLAKFDLRVLTVFSDYGLTHSVFSVLYVTFPNRWLVSIEGLFLFTGGICHSALAWDLGLLSFSIRLGDFPQVR